MRTGKDGTSDFGTTFGAMGDGESLDEREKNVRENFWGKFRKVAALIPFADDIVAAYYCAMDPQTPSRVRAMLLGALAYFILPIDAVPDFIAGLGYTDDAAILAGVMSLVSRHIQPRHRQAAAKALGKDGSNPSGPQTT